MDTGVRKSKENLHKSSESPRISAWILYCWNLQSLGYIFVAVIMGLSSFDFCGGLRKTHVFWSRVRNGPSRSSRSLILAPKPIINRKRVRNFLSVINSNLGPILPRFRDIAGFLRKATTPLFHPNFRGVTLGLDCRCCGSAERRL